MLQIWSTWHCRMFDSIRSAVDRKQRRMALLRSLRKMEMRRSQSQRREQRRRWKRSSRRPRRSGPPRAAAAAARRGPEVCVRHCLVLICLPISGMPAFGWVLSSMVDLNVQFLNVILFSSWPGIPFTGLCGASQQALAAAAVSLA